MFVLAKTHQSVLTENIRLRKYNEELVEKNETIADDLRTKYTRELDNVRYDHERSLKSKSDDYSNRITDKDNQLTKLQNEVDRVRLEGEARLALAEDIHQDEIIALEEKYDAKIEAMEIKYKAKDEALDTEMYADKAHMEAQRQEVLAKAEREGSEIIQKALENVQVIYKNALDILTARMKDLPTMTPAEIINLIKASTENYPALPETLTSTSSSK